MLPFHVSAVDIAILIAYVLGTRLLFGWYVARKHRANDSEGYFLGGRRISWMLIGLSFYVSNMSGSTFVGLPGSGYLNGISVYHYEWIPVVILILFITFILPFYLKSRVFTAPQFLERRYDHRSKLLFSFFLLFANIFIDAAAALYAGGMVLQVLFPQIPFWLTVALTCSIAGLYITFGGLDAVVLNDTLQAFMIFIGGTVIALMTYNRVAPWADFKASVAPGHLHLIQPAGDPVLPWPGMITGVLIVGIYFWCTNQFIIQRALGARSLSHARWGSLLAGLLKLPNLFILILPGVMAQQLYQNLDHPDLVFPWLAFDVLPVGFRGLILAALAAAILSSLEAIFNSASTLFTMDFVKHYYPRLSERQLVSSGRIATIGFMVLSALWAPQIVHFPSLWQYLQSILAYVTPPVVVVFILGIFWSRGTATAANVTLALGIPLGLGCWIANEILTVIRMHFLYGCGLMTLIALGLYGGVTSATLKRRDPAYPVTHVCWKPSYWRKETLLLTQMPWYQNYRILSVGLLLVTAVILAIWW